VAAGLSIGALFFQIFVFSTEKAKFERVIRANFPESPG